ncbi:major facilitator superfamily (MFS) transporter [Legionella beliardensis]|uniref:Major facilitator superfamily (MFS) transporter n=1 Tax=Legionella beliardensis TaxID=91822 RepID=A0A378I3J4_9GAMM|nr:multidrug effflux MFS transporter [Legionella beliardensis]STX29738.1 major facilitator superfamily (MFS) transporter [Legionella beliardensis]
MSDKPTPHDKHRTIFLILMVFIVACIETDIYLPAMPDMMRYFATTEAMIQSLLSWNFIGICLSGPLYGPLSESYGRKRLLITAMSIFTLGSLGTVYSDSIHTMLIFRLLQGLGCGGCFTIGTAIIFDKFHHEEATKAINNLNGIIPVIMAAAPLIGGYLNLHYGFRSNFTVIAGLSLISLFICFWQLDESLPAKQRTPFDLKGILSDFARAMRCFRFWAPTILVSSIFAGYLSYISYSALLLVNDFGVSKAIFPFYQATALIAFLCASLTANRMIKQVGVNRMKRYGMSLLGFGGISFIILSLVWPSQYQLFHSAMLIYSFGAGWLIGPFFTESMEVLPDIKGVTASLVTSFRLLFTACFISVVSSFYTSSPKPLIVGFIFLFVLGAITLFFYQTKTDNVLIATEP